MVGINRRMSLGLASVGIYFLTVQLVGSILARYSRDLGVGLVGTGLLWSSAFLISFVLRPVAGHLADRTGSYLMMILGGALALVSSLIYLVFGTPSGLLVGRLVQGAGNAFFISPSIVAVASAGPARMALGLRAMVISMASIVAPLIAGFVVDSLGYKPVFFLAVLLSFAVILTVVPEVKNREEVREKGGWREALTRTVLVLAAVASMTGMTFIGVQGLIQVHYRDLGYPATVYGMFLMFMGVSNTISRYISGRISRGCVPTAISGFLLTTAGVALLYILYPAPACYLPALVIGFGIGLTVPVVQLMVVSSVPEYVSNRAASVYAMGFDLGGFLGPALYGYAAEVLGYAPSYVLMAIPSVGAVVLLLLVRGHGNGSTT